MNLSVLMVGMSCYLLLFITGIGFSLALTRHRAYPLTVSLGLAPIISSAIAIIIGTWFLNYQLSLPTMVITMATVAAFSLSLAIHHGWQHPMLISSTYKNTSLTICVFAMIVLLIGSTWNNYSHGYLYHRLSPDIASYGMTSEWILRGHQTSNISLSYVNEILINAHRGGFPTIIALLTYVLGSKHANVFMIMQLFTFILFACSAWTMAWIIFEKHTYKFSTPQKSHLIIAMVAACILANGGIIYYLSEGFYPQILSASLLNIVFAMLLEGKINRSNFILAALLSAAMLPVYNECFAILCLFLVASFGINLLTRQFENIKIDIFYGLSTVAALLLALPISKVFFTFSINNSANVANVGYPQPNWALPSDVVGLSNIFSSMKHYLNDDIAITALPFHINPLSLVLSLWVAIELLKLCIQADRKLSNKIITLLLSWLGIYSLNLYLLYFKVYGPLNYLYDKVITNFAPVITLAFIIAILTSPKMKFTRINTINRYSIPGIKLGLTMALIFTSITKLAHDQSTYRDYVDIDSVTQIANAHVLDNYEIIFNHRGNRNGIIVGKFRYIDATSESIIGAILQKQIIDQWWGNDVWENPAIPRYFSLSKDVAIIIRKNDLTDATSYIKHHQKNVIINTPSYIVVDTNRTLASLLQGERYANFTKYFTT